MSLVASEVLPVAHVDRDSARRLAKGEPLLERCAFRRVAAFVRLPVIPAQARA